MRKKRNWFTIVLVIALILENPQLTQAEVLLQDMTSSDCRLSWSERQALCTEEKEIYDITYYLNGGMEDILTRRTYTQADLPMKLPIPERTGYNFAGWYLESSCQNKLSTIEDCRYGDLTLYAKWTRCIDSAYNVQMYSYHTGSMVSGTDKELKNCNYGFVNNIEIPGMPSTRERDFVENLVSSYGQCPQGICLTEDYYLVTAYSAEDDDSMGSLYVFDRETGEYLVTLGMKKKSHLGGLTYDGTYVWICHSNSKALECISYYYIKKVAEQKPKAFVDSSGLFEEYRVRNMPSCVTAYDGKLWVATHNPYFKSVMVSYEYRDERLVAVDYYRIPEKVQGIAFDVTGNVYLSTSYGREKSSYLKVYDNVEALGKAPDKPMIKVEMPPCSEEICMSDGKVYVLFESASRKYFEGTDGRGRSLAPIDKILTIEVASVLH